MQHEFGKKLHRSTVWRRYSKKAEARRNERLGPSGRQIADDGMNKSFLLFSGAVISLQNQPKSWGYGDIFSSKHKPGTFGYRSFSKALYQRLVKSGFPPQMLAVAVADVIPLNKITRVKNSNAELHVEVLGMASGEVVKKESFLSREEKILKGTPTLRYVDPAELPEPEQSLDQKALGEALADEIDNRNGWKEPLGSDEPQQRKCSPKRRIPGTPAHRIDFRLGASISKRMASYWRKHASYRECIVFVSSLIHGNLPRIPSPHNVSVASNIGDLITIQRRSTCSR